MAALVPAGSAKPFNETFLALLRESPRFTTHMGTPNVAAFARSLDGVHYETIRKVLAGEREPTPQLIESVARALRVPPEHFLEYRLWLARRQFDVREVGYERALENLRRWSASPRRRRS